MDRVPIAERHLLFSEKGSAVRRPLVIRVFAPMPVDAQSEAFPVDAETASCVVEIEATPEADLGALFGADSLQATAGGRRRTAMEASQQAV